MTSIAPEIIPVCENIELRAVAEEHAGELHRLVVKNRAWLQNSLNWPQYVGTEADTLKNIQSNRMLHERGYAKMFLIFRDDHMVGVLSFNSIEPLNKTGYIGYWLDEEQQGQGILSQALQAFMHYYAERREIRRFVIKCRVENAASNRVALNNGFTLEGCLKEAEFLNGGYDDQNIYARILEL